MSLGQFFRVRNLLIAGFAIMVAACQAPPPKQLHASLDLKRNETLIAVMPLDVQLFELTTSGIREPKADWTEQAKEHVAAALRVVQFERRLTPIYFNSDSLPIAEQQRMAQLIKLHNLVGKEILVQKYVPQLRPPHKEGTFDWSIGPAVKKIGEQTGADYGLFITIEDSYSSGGRQAMKFIGALFGVVVPGGAQIGFASLVDLETGQIAWFGTLARGTGDLRTEDKANDAVRLLFADLPDT